MVIPCLVLLCSAAYPPLLPLEMLTHLLPLPFLWVFFFFHNNISGIQSSCSQPVQCDFKNLPVGVRLPPQYSIKKPSFSLLHVLIRLTLICMSCLDVLACKRCCPWLDLRDSYVKRIGPLTVDHVLVDPISSFFWVTDHTVACDEMQLDLFVLVLKYFERYLMQLLN
jgi:hypothetical protein